MADPKRWLDTDEATVLERDVLSSGLCDEPPSGVEDGVWEGMLPWLTLPPTPGGGSPAGGALGDPGAAGGLGSAGQVAAAAPGGALAALASAGALKTLALGFGAGVVVMGSLQVVEPWTKPHPVPTAVLQTKSSMANVPLRPLVVNEDSPKRQAVRTEVSPPAPSGPSSKSSPDRGEVRLPVLSPSSSAAVAAFQLEVPPESDARSIEVPPVDSTPVGLKGETTLVHQARTAMRKGQYAQAFSALATAQQRHPGGVLGQERQALMVELLLRSGQPMAASREARAFLSMYPDSPHAERIRRFLRPD